MLALVRPKPKLLHSMQFFTDQGMDMVGIAPIDIVDHQPGLDALHDYLALQPATAVPIATPFIITSTEAAHRLVTAMKQLGQVSHLAYCIGDATADIVQNQFAQCVLPSRHTSEGLLETLSRRNEPLQSACLVKGQGGRTLLSDSLTAQGTDVKAFDLYKRVVLTPPFVPSHFAWENVDTIIATSAELAEATLKAYPADHLQQKCWIVPSDRVKQGLISQGCEEIYTSDGATNAHLLGCVKMLQRGRT